MRWGGKGMGVSDSERALGLGWRALCPAMGLGSQKLT